MTDAEDESAVRWRVWEEAWAQSRHLETMRSQYLGFFFTILLAVTAVAGKDITAGSLRTSASLTLFSVLGVGLDLLAAFLLVAVVRMGTVLQHYLNTILSIQEEALRAVDRPSPPLWARRVPTASASRAGWRLRSTQGAAQSVLELAVVSFPLALAAAAAKALTESRISTGAVVACCLAAGFSLAFSGACLWASHS